MKSLSSKLSVLALCAAAVPAVADITADDLWSQWQATATDMGNTITADVTETGSGLTLSNVTMTQTVDGNTTTQILPEVTMTEAGGSVEIGFGQPHRLITEFVEDGQTVSIEFLTTFENMATTASGDPDAISYVFSADRIEVVPGEITGPPNQVPSVNMNLAVIGISGSYLIDGSDENRTISSEGSADGISMALDMTAPPGETGALKAAFSVGALSSTGGGSMAGFNAYMRALGAQDGSASPAPTAADALQGSVEYADLSYDMQFADGSESFDISGGNDSGMAEFDFSEGRLSYDVSSVNGSTTIASNQMPFPVELSMASGGFSVLLPLLAAPEPSPFGMGIDVTDLELGEALWSMFDPGQAIPRDPATIRLDVSGMIQLFSDLSTMDPTTMAGPPGEVRSMTINELLISAAGVELTGDGSVEMAPGSFPPMPVGSVNLAMQGLNGLLQSLVGAGLLPPEQVGMFGAMTGMFARPGPTPDSLESTIEFLPGGSITANGVPLR